MYKLPFTISHAVNRNIDKLTSKELELSISLIQEVINNKNFKYDKKLFKDRLNVLKQRRLTI
jgi:hypothetical protein